MKYFISCFFSLLLFTASSFAQEDVFGSMMFDGEERDYILHIPPTYDGFAAVPLVFNLHGLGSNAAQQLVYSNMNAVADTGNFLICYPNAIDNNWNSGFAGSPTENVDDVGFISALIDHLKGLYAIDENRVYSTGMSNGGFMSYRLACELSDRIVAVASVTGLMGHLVHPDCNPDRAVPVLQMHGTDDPTVNYDGEEWFLSVDETVELWRMHNGCQGEATFSMVPDINTDDGATAEIYHYSNCEGDSEVMLYKIINAEHTWPGAPLTIGITCHDFSASEDIWLFFKKHSFDDANSITNIESVDILVYPNPASSEIYITTNNEKIETLLIYNVRGSEVMDLDASKTNSLNISDLKAGLYTLKIKMTSGKEFNSKFLKL